MTISDGGTVLAVVPLNAGQAAFTTSSLSAGTHTITATFSGNETAAPSDATITQQVDEPAATSTTSAVITDRTRGLVVDATGQSRPPRPSRRRHRPTGQVTTAADVAASSSTDGLTTAADSAASSSTDAAVVPGNDDGGTGPVGVRRVNAVAAAPDACPTTTSSSTTVPASPVTQPRPGVIGTGGRLPATGACGTSSSAFAALLMLLGGSFVSDRQRSTPSRAAQRLAASGDRGGCHDGGGWGATATRRRRGRSPPRSLVLLVIC